MAIYINTAESIQLKCSPPLDLPICAGSKVECKCVVRGTNSITQWSFNSDAALCDGNGIHLSQTPPCDGEGVPASSGNCGPYLQAFNFNPTSGVSDSCTTSQLHILVDPTLQSVKLMCTDLTSMPPVDTAAVTLRVISELN